MSTLTGQQIKDTYDGLLKLEDSTTGITSNYQQIQDGLGNSTGSRISSSGILSNTIPALTNQLLKADYYGLGMSATGSAPVVNMQNKTLYTLFYDAGIYDYSAITYNLNTLTSTSDVVTMAFYTPQIVPNFGMAPKDLIMSGMTLLSTGSTGVKTLTLPSTLSFSGRGGGYYIAAFFIANAGVTPTVRITNGQAVNNQSFAQSLGYALNVAGTASLVGTKTGTPGTAFSVLNLPFQSTYSESDISGNLNTTVLTNSYGFLLNTIR